MSLERGRGVCHPPHDYKHATASAPLAVVAARLMGAYSFTFAGWHMCYVVTCLAPLSQCHVSASPCACSVLRVSGEQLVADCLVRGVFPSW